MENNPMKTVVEEANFSTRPLKVLAVDDEEFNLDILEKHLKKAGYKPVCVANGIAALDYLQTDGDSVDIILLDKMMPEMDGIEVLRKIKADSTLGRIPVIMQTAAVSTEEAVEGIREGAYYYITKPYAAEMLLSVVDAAARDARHSDGLETEVDRTRAVIDMTMQGAFEVKTPKEARILAAHIAHYTPDPARLVVALAALITNAIEHGNLAIGYEAKRELIMEGRFDTEVERRLLQPEYRNRRVRISFDKNAKQILVHVADEGEGFAWKEYVDFEPRRITEPNGRGIAMANIMSGGRVEYSEKGNEVTISISLVDE